MTKKEIYLISGIAAIALLIPMMASAKKYNTILQSFLPTWEGFSPTPYWDYKQWSWGYGTKVPGSVNDANINPGGTITREKAWTDAMQHINTDYNYLRTIATYPLNENQWAAWLSFSYNLGRGNADNLVTNINAGNLSALETQWKLYINAGGVPNQTLINRRNAEWDLYIS